MPELKISYSAKQFQFMISNNSTIEILLLGSIATDVPQEPVQAVEAL